MLAEVIYFIGYFITYICDKQPGDANTPKLPKRATAAVPMYLATAVLVNCLYKTYNLPP